MHASRASRRTLAIAVTIVATAGSVLGQALPSSAADDPGTVHLVSVDSAGVQGNDPSGYPVASSDGRYVAFTSSASNLAPGDTPDTWDVFLRDRVAGTTIRVSDPAHGFPSGGFGPSISADGRYVAYATFATGGPYVVLVYDRETGETEPVSVNRAGEVLNGSSPEISADGRYVVFMSSDSLVPGDTNNRYGSDIYVRDRVADTIRRVSVSTSGRQANAYSEHPTISDDGRYVAFASMASNLVPNDKGMWDIFVRDLRRRTTERAVVDPQGRRPNASSRNPSLSATGRFLTFDSTASDLVAGDTNEKQDVFVRDLFRGTNRLVSVNNRGGQANLYSNAGAISASGRYVAFSSAATNLVPRDTNDHWDAFLWDRRTETIRRVSVNSSGRQGRRDSDATWVSPNGRFVGFDSVSANLVEGDVNGRLDAFVWDRGTS